MCVELVYLELLGPPSALREPTAMHTSPQKQPKQTPLHDTDCHHQTAMPIDDPDPLLGPAEAPLGPRPSEAADDGGLKVRGAAVGLS